MKKKIEKIKEFRLIDKSLYFPEEKILVLGDLHIGYEEYLNEQGVFLPRLQFKEIMKDLEKVFKITGRVNEIIVLGDLKHEFGSISCQEWKEVREVLAQQVYLVPDTELRYMSRR